MNRHTVTRAIAALGTAAILAGTAQTAANADTGTSRSAETATPAAYINYLTASKDAGAAQTLSDFKGLSAPDQEKYLDYLNDPKVLEAFLQEAAESEPGAEPKTATAARTMAAEDSTSLFDGDVVVEAAQESTFTPDTTAGVQAARGNLPKGTWESKYTHSQKILGVTVTKLSVWVNYYTNGSRITKVNFADGGKRNFNAAVAISMGVPKAWKDGSYANGSVVWEGSIVYKGFGVSIDKRQKVWANQTGYRGGYLKNI